MHSPPRILIVDDQPQNIDVLKDRLEGQGYEILSATSGELALTIATDQQPDLILLDIIMPGMDGIEVCRRLKGNVSLPLIPVIMVTAKTETQDILAGLEAGADEYLTKPLDQSALIARVESMLRLKSFHDVAWDQANQLEAQALIREDWNETLEGQIQKQTTDLERTARLKRFVSSQLAEWVVASDDLKPFVNRRQDITIIRCSLRDFAAFVDTTEPEVVAAILKDYHTSIGQLNTQFGGHLDRFTVDQLLVVFNAFLPCADPVLRGIDMAIEMRQRLNKLTDEWRSCGQTLDFGIGVAHGDATVGLFDVDGEWDYTIIGSTRQLASRLCQESEADRIFVSESVWKAVSTRTHTEPAGELYLGKNLEPTPIFKINPIRIGDSFHPLPRYLESAD